MRRKLWQRDWPDHSALRAEATLVVPFQDADPTGVAWHGNYFRYYDAARVVLLERLEFGYRDMAKLGQIWPIIDARVRYERSLPFDTPIRITAQLVEWEFRLRIYYQIFGTEGVRLNEAYTVQVPVAAETEALVVGVPKALQQRIARLIQTESASQ